MNAARLGRLPRDDFNALFWMLSSRLDDGPASGGEGGLQSHLDAALNDPDLCRRWQYAVLGPHSGGLWTDEDLDDVVTVFRLDVRQESRARAMFATFRDRHHKEVMSLLARIELLRLDDETARAHRLLESCAPAFTESEIDDLTDLVTATHERRRKDVFRNQWPVGPGGPGLHARETCDDIRASAEPHGGTERSNTKLYQILITNDSALDTLEAGFESKLLEMVRDVPATEARDRLDRIFIDRRLSRGSVGDETLNVERALQRLAASDRNAMQTDEFQIARAFIEKDRSKVIRLIRERDAAARAKWRSTLQFHLRGRTEPDRDQMFGDADAKIEASVALRDELRRQFDVVQNILAEDSATLAEAFHDACDSITLPALYGPEDIRTYATRLLALDTVTNEQRELLRERLPRLEIAARAMRRESIRRYAQLQEEATRIDVSLATMDADKSAENEALLLDVLKSQHRQFSELRRQAAKQFSDEQLMQLRGPTMRRRGASFSRPESPADTAEKPGRRVVTEHP